MTTIHKCDTCSIEKSPYPFEIKLTYPYWVWVDDCRPSSDTGHHRSTMREVEFCSYDCLVKYLQKNNEMIIRSHS